jgi:5-deoxy-glucuronate isomerase
MLEAKEKSRLEGWRYQSPETPGFHNVIIPGKADCKALSVFRLNLPCCGSHSIGDDTLELNAVLISGAANITAGEFAGKEMKRFDSFYLPAKTSAVVEASEDCVFFIAGALYEGIGAPFFRAWDASLPIGDIHQIHGSGAGRREVMFTLDPKTPASNLLCGLTWSGVGTWTSWPPHQHSKDLEEAYCYFDMPPPKFGLHISYLESGRFEDIVAHPVWSGTFVLAPEGYHPTVASPATQNIYFWCMASFTPESRRYDLAVLDPLLADT